MKKEITINNKEKLEEAIEGIVNQFYDVTGIAVTNIEIGWFNRYGEVKESVYEVRMKFK